MTEVTAKLGDFGVAKVGSWSDAEVSSGKRPKIQINPNESIIYVYYVYLCLSLFISLQQP